MQPIDFAQPEKPVCSVVVLAWRLAGPLLECLRSLRASEDAPPFELVIVLNGASDDVRQTVAASVSGARVVDIPENVGFGGGCNAGAAGSTAEYLVFLNDDTLVDPRWLAGLCETASADPSIGAVASLLLNPDGSVQEAGSRLLADAGTVQLGHGLSRGRAAAEGLLEGREIDYGSAAALLVRAAAFRDAAGFDPAFEPAYFEDVDLQLRLKSAGQSVWLQPRARVTHLSGASTANATVFREWAWHHSAPVYRRRWATVLENTPAPDAPPTELAVVPVAPGLVSGGRSLPSAADIVAGSKQTALEISRGFADWVSAHYAAAVVDLEELRELRTTAARQAEELNTAEAEIEALTVRVDELIFRLDDLDHRGPIRLARWQAALFLDRRRRRQNDSAGD